jgi:hypothetical protein
MRLGYSVEEVKKGLKDENSQVNQLYHKIQDDKKILFSPVHPGFVPSVISSYNSPTAASGTQSSANGMANSSLKTGILKGKIQN